MIEWILGFFVGYFLEGFYYRFKKSKGIKPIKPKPIMQSPMQPQELGKISINGEIRYVTKETADFVNALREECRKWEEESIFMENKLKQMHIEHNTGKVKIDDFGIPLWIDFPLEERLQFHKEYNQHNK